MDLSQKIDTRLWEAIRSSYSNKEFTSSILDSIHFLGDIIRDKTGLESDGVSLVGEAFGGKKPKLKINKLQTESERNIQKGIEQILRGIYQAIRNPRSHEKYKDDEEETDKLIMFVDYLLQTIDKAKTPFSDSLFLKRIFDDSFVESTRYAKLLIQEIPKKKKLDIFIQAFNQKEDGDGNKLRYFLRELYNEFNEVDKKQVMEIVSEELKYTNDESVIIRNIQIFSDLWFQIDEASRYRIENKLIKSVKEGKLNNHYSSGLLGRWSIRILPQGDFLKEQITDVLLKKLKIGDYDEFDYVINYFINLFFDKHFFSKINPTFENIVISELESGYRLLYDALSEYVESSHNFISFRIKTTYDSFKEKIPAPRNNDDDLPF